MLGRRLSGWLMKLCGYKQTDRHSDMQMEHDYGRTDVDAKILHNCGDGEVPEKRAQTLKEPLPLTEEEFKRTLR